MNLKALEQGQLFLSGRQLLAVLAGAIVFVLLVGGAREARDPKEVKDHGYDLTQYYVLNPGDDPRRIVVLNDAWSPPLCNTSPKDFYISYQNLRPTMKYGVLFPNATRQALVFDKESRVFKWENQPDNKGVVTPINCVRIVAYKDVGGVKHNITAQLVKR